MHRIMYALVPALLAGCGGTSTKGEDAGQDTAVDAPPDTADDVPDVEDVAGEEPVEEPDVEDAVEEDGPPPPCPVAGDLGAGDHQVDLAFDGAARHYRMHVPPTYDPATPTPLVVNMHGYTSNSWQQVLFSGMNTAADANGFIALYPDGLGSSWNAGACCGTSASTGVDDVGFLRSVVGDVSTRLCIDTSMVYATGMSNGGYMTHRLACEANDVFAAFAPVAGAMGIPGCTPARPVTMIAYHGMEDGLVPYADGSAAIDLWVGLDGCTGDPAWTAYGDSWCEIWETCDGGVKVGLCTLTPMGHCWPGGSETLCLPFIGPYNDDIPANQHMWNLMSAYSL